MSKRLRTCEYCLGRGNQEFLINGSIYHKETCVFCGGQGQYNSLETILDIQKKNSFKVKILENYIERGNSAKGRRDVGALLDLAESLPWAEFREHLDNLQSDAITRFEIEALFFILRGEDLDVTREDIADAEKRRKQDGPRSPKAA
jgi:hypothetical protein